MNIMDEKDSTIVIKEEFVESEPMISEVEIDQSAHCSSGYGGTCYELSQQILEEQRKINGKLDSVLNDLNILKRKRKESDEFYGDILQLLRRNFAISERMFKRMNGEMPMKDDLVVIEELLPLSTLAKLYDFEARLNEPTFKTLTGKFLRKAKGALSLGTVFRRIATDALYVEFNLDGRAGKKRLNSLVLFRNVLYESCASNIGRPEYEKILRREIGLAHNRYHKSNSLKALRQPS